MHSSILYSLCITVAWLTIIPWANSADAGGECQVTVSIPQSTLTQCEKGLQPSEDATTNHALCSQYLSITSNQQAQLEMLTRKITELEDLLNRTKGNTEEPPLAVSGLTTSYVRWGRTVCPSTSLLLYKGVAGKSFYTHAGGGGNYLCLPMDPEWPDKVVAGFQSKSYIYGVEYEDQSRNSHLHDHDVPCAVCQVNGRGHVRMIPAKRTCPNGWTKEFSGTLVAERSSHSKSTFECLDESPEVRPGGVENKNGGLFYAVEGSCGGSLPCPPYIQGYELSCVVCTK